MITAPPIYCSYCGTYSLITVDHGPSPMFVGGRCRNCGATSYVTVDDAKRMASHPGRPGKPTEPPTTAAQRVRFATDLGKQYAGVLRQLAMHPTSGQFFALVECDDGVWRQVHAATLQTETPS